MTHAEPWWRRFLLAHLWFVHTPVVIVVKATPNEILQTLNRAAKPSAQRLHHRNLFLNGRRYYVQPNRGGFRLTTTRSVTWRFRRRTAAVAVTHGVFSELGDDVTRVQMDVRITLSYLLDAFLIPVFMTSILIYVPWPPVVIGLALVLLYGLSWMGHRYHAALEANEMVWFVQRVLDDLIPAEIKELSAMAANTQTVYRFEEAWERFYEEQTHPDRDS